MAVAPVADHLEHSFREANRAGGSWRTLGGREEDMEKRLDGIIDSSLGAAGLSEPQRQRIARAGLRPIAQALGPRGFPALIARLRWSAADIVRWGSSPASMLVPRLLIHVPGYFRDRARHVPDPCDAHALESLGWLLMAALREQVARVARRRWWIPPAPGFVTALPDPLPPLSPAVARAVVRHGCVDPALPHAHYRASLMRWQQGLAGRQWHEEVAGPCPGLPFYPSLVDIPDHVDLAGARAALARAWQARVAVTDQLEPPTPARITLSALRNAAALQQCDDRYLPPGSLSMLDLQGLVLAGSFPLLAGSPTVTRVYALTALHPVYTRLFRALHELGWNDLVYQTSGAGCFRGIIRTAAQDIRLPGGELVRLDPFDSPDLTTMEHIRAFFTPAHEELLLRALRASRRLSSHGMGTAIDINVPENRQDRAARPSGSMSPRVTALFEAFHFRGGACSGTTAPMHFEYREEPGAPPRPASCPG